MGYLRVILFYLHICFYQMNSLYHVSRRKRKRHLSCWNMNLSFILKTVYIVVLLNLFVTAADAGRNPVQRQYVCRGVRCQNNGILLMGSNIFGPCRCICGPNYVGPFCQYPINRKRSLDGVYDVLRRLQRITDTRTHRRWKR